MVQKKKLVKHKKSITKKNHLHLWDIPKKYFPRNTKSKEYVRDLLLITNSLQYTNRNIQYSAQVSVFNIKSINDLHFVPKPDDVFREIELFVYHYENYCFRLYAYREKLMQFINAVLPVGYEDKEVRMRHILINPIVKQAGLIPYFEKFKTNAFLSNVIADRAKLTHRLYYNKEFDRYLRPQTKKEIKSDTEFSNWCNEWKKEILLRGQRTNKCTFIIDDINNSLAKKLTDYKINTK